MGHIPSGLHQRLVVLAMLPDLLLAELDTSNA
jgi:hypothetical protein